jgi:hypothetical protein
MNATRLVILSNWKLKKKKKHTVFFENIYIVYVYHAHMTSNMQQVDILRLKVKDNVLV